MPHLVAGVVADAPAVDWQYLVGFRIDVGDVGDVGPAAGVAFHRIFQRTEMATEGDLRIVVEILIVKHQYRILVESIQNRRERRSVQRLGQVDTGNFRTEIVCQLAYFDAHRFGPCLPRLAGIEAVTL